MDDIDQFILDVTTRKPHKINHAFTRELRDIILPTLAARTTLPDNVVIYGVDQNRGRCYMEQRRITVPTWILNPFRIPHFAIKDAAEHLEYKQWYLAHELAHQANWDEFKHKHDEPCVTILIFTDFSSLITTFVEGDMKKLESGQAEFLGPVDATDPDNIKPPTLH